MINKNILEVCLSPDLGGLELYMSRCSNALSSEFNISCVISNNSKLNEYLQDLQTFELNRKSSFSLLNAIKLAKIIDKQQIDIVHIHWTKDIPIVVLAKLFSQTKPKIVQTRHMTMTRFKNDFYHKFLYKNIDCMIAVTKEVQNQLERFIPQQIAPRFEQIYLGASTPELYNFEEIASYKEQLKCHDSFIIGFVGRINEFKGQYLLIEAMKHLEKKDLDIKVFFVGHAMSEDYLQELKQKVKTYNLEKKIHFLGFTKEPHKFMQMSDCIVVASRNETFGLVAIEAMQMGTVVIGANSGGLLEIIDDNSNGILFENQDANDLAKKIELLYNDRSLLDSIAQSGRQKAKEYFNDEQQFEKLKNLIKAL